MPRRMNRRLRASRRGFTIIELLVTIAVVAVLVALLLPAVQSARESARRTECRSHLRQLALALHGYHDVHRMFPLNYGTDFNQGARGASWLALVLPYIEQTPLFDRIQFEQPLSHPGNRLVAETVVPLFICPSDTHTGRMTFRSNVPGEWAVHNYKACAGSNWAWGLFSPVTVPLGRHRDNPDGLDHCTGIMCRNGPGVAPTVTRMQDVHDGASNTFALGESVPEWCRHTWWWWFNASTGTCAIPLNYKPEPDLQVAMEGDWFHNYSFLSRHSGGGHFAMVDGSVRFIGDAIDRDVYRGLGTIQGGEVANAP